MTEAIGRLFPVGGPVPPELVIGREGEIDELNRRLREGMSTMLVGPRRVGKTTVCEAVCDRLRRDHGFLVIRIEVPERPDSRELLQLILDRCARLSLADEGRAALRMVAPAIEKLLGIELDLGVFGPMTSSRSARCSNSRWSSRGASSARRCCSWMSCSGLWTTPIAIRCSTTSWTSTRARRTRWCSSTEGKSARSRACSASRSISASSWIGRPSRRESRLPVGAGL